MLSDSDLLQVARWLAQQPTAVLGAERMADKLAVLRQTATTVSGLSTVGNLTGQNPLVKMADGDPELLAQQALAIERSRR